MINKRGGGEMTVPRLVKYILLIAILVIVFIGLSTGMLVPLGEKIGGIADSVLILFHLRGADQSQGCFTDLVSNYGVDGENFLKNLGVNDKEEGLEAKFTVCSGGICTLEFGDKYYRTKQKGTFEYSVDNENWKSLSGLMSEPLQNIELFKIYEELSSVSNSKGETLFNLFGEKKLGKYFVLFGDGEGKNGVIYAIWQAGYWVIFELDKYSKPSLVYFGRSDDEALITFRSRVNADWDYDDFVSFYEGDKLEVYSSNNPKWKNSKVIFGNCGGNDEFDCDEDFFNLRSYFISYKNSALDEIELFEKQVNYFEEGFFPDKINLSGEEFLLSSEEYTSNVILSSEKEKYRIKPSYMGRVYYNALSFLSSDELGNYYYTNISIEKFDGGKWLLYDESFNPFFLPKNEFEELYKNSLIKEFVWKKCN